MKPISEINSLRERELRLLRMDLIEVFAESYVLTILYKPTNFPFCAFNRYIFDSILRTSMEHTIKLKLYEKHITGTIQKNLNQ